MAEGSNMAVYGVLLAVVLVGAAGLYFTMSANTSPQVVYVSGASGGGGSRFSAPSLPFSVLGRGKATGLDSLQIGKGTITLSQTLDLIGVKTTIVCSGKVLQGALSVVMHTCGDDTDVGMETFICDPGPSAAEGGTGSQITDPTTSATCDGPPFGTVQANGAHVFESIGSPAKFKKKVKEILIGGVSASMTTFLEDTFYDCVSNPACDGASCNNCLGPTPPVSCRKDPDPGGTYADTVQECDYFKSSTCGCDCYNIYVSDEVDMENLKSGQTLAFEIEASLELPPDGPICP